MQPPPTSLFRPLARPPAASLPSLARAEVAEARPGWVMIRVKLDDRLYRLTFRSGSDCLGGADGAALLALALLPAMRRARALSLGAPVSPRLLASLPTIQEIQHCWDRHSAEPIGLLPLEVDAPVRPPVEPSPDRGVACFFTAGVDSSFSVLKHYEEVTSLVFVHGFDVPVRDVELRNMVADGVRQAAHALEKPLLEIETDLREFSEGHVGWLDYHGAALAAVALLLAPAFRKVYIPATHTYSNLRPLGSHPLLDPLWSTEEVEIVHDGCEASRIEKIQAVAGHAPALSRLRVCWENRGGAYNCGRCEKCLRTMVILRALGLSPRCPTFPELDLPAVADVQVPSNRFAWEETLKLLVRTGADPGLASVVSRCLGRR